MTKTFNNHYKDYWLRRHPQRLDGEGHAVTSKNPNSGAFGLPFLCPKV